MSTALLSRRLQLFPVSAMVNGNGESTQLTCPDYDLHPLALDYGAPLFQKEIIPCRPE